MYSRHQEIAKAISGLLSRSIEDAKNKYGGYLPDDIVEKAQLNYVSPFAVTNLWGRDGYRFVLSRKVDDNKCEIIGTALISQSQDTLFFFTNKYNNLKFSNIALEVNFDLKIDGIHNWFDKFDMPSIQEYKPQKFNQLANFAIEKIGCRGLGLGKLLIEEIIKNYSEFYLKSKHQTFTHSQNYFCGQGLFQIADPSWLKYMIKIGFGIRYGAETFYLDQPWSPLVPTKNYCKYIDNITYNAMYGLPQLYDNIDQKSIMDNILYIPNRIPKVKELANNNNAKLQYYQLLLPLDNFINR